MNDSANIPEDVHAFLNTIADDEMWIENYVLGEWDSCKWKFGGTELLKDITLKDIVHYTVTTMFHCPHACYDAFRASTRLVWSVWGSASGWATNIYVEDNDFGIHFSPVEPLHFVLNCWLAITGSPVLSFLFWHVGAFIAIFTFFWITDKDSSQKDIIIVFFPYLIYAVGTMLLLSAPSHRYFFSGLVVIPPCLLYFRCSAEKADDTIILETGEAQ